jgi:hypothetical protein
MPAAIAAVCLYSAAEPLFGAEPKSSRSPAASAEPNKLAPFEVREKNAMTVKVLSSVLGVHLGMSVKEAHAKLDRLSDPAHPPKEEAEEEESGGSTDVNKEKESEAENIPRKILWQLKTTDYYAIFVKSGEKGRLIYVQALLRPGKEIPFNKLGELKKAPIHDSRTVAWDVLRPKQPLFRVVGNGNDEKASAVTIFVVKRPDLPEERDERSVPRSSPTGSVHP